MEAAESSGAPALVGGADAAEDVAKDAPTLVARAADLMGHGKALCQRIGVYCNGRFFSLRRSSLSSLISIAGHEQFGSNLICWLCACSRFIDVHPLRVIPSLTLFLPSFT